MKTNFTTETQRHGEGSSLVFVQTFPSPGGTHENSPTFQRWVIDPLENESRQGRQKANASARSVVPAGLVAFCSYVPALKRWATFEKSLPGLR
jgi:hypothetical protein